MNEQQLQQILTIQQAIAAAATAAMINTLLNPQQAAANLVNQNALTDSPTPNATDFQDQDQDAPTSDAALRQDNAVVASIASAAAAAAAAGAAPAPPTTSSNMMIPQTNQSPNNNHHQHSNKKLKSRHNQAPQAFSRQHNSPSSSSTFLPNNVGLPRKLVRGQDVWLGRGAEQTRQILKCMWCNQSFRTLAEMTQHMKITQHYTNIISQEQITSWKQPENSEQTTPSSRQQSNKQSISSKNLDDIHETTTSSEKSIDSEREGSFSNDDDDEPPPPPPPPQRQHRAKSRPERTASNNSNSNTKSITSTINATTNNNNNNSNSNSNNNRNKSIDQETKDQNSNSNDDLETNDENKCKRESTSREESQDNDNDDECDRSANKNNNSNDKKRPREDDSGSDTDTNTTATNANISIKQDPDGQKEGAGGTGDPLSALETMVEKSFDPRMRPGMASGGILQRLGIDEEVCPPWQHINYANWYAAAAYGHPMAAALLAAGINLQNGIKLSKNVTPKKSDD